MNRYAKYREDPVAYAREVLGVEWWSKQQDIARSVVENKRTLVKSAFGTGKTHLSGGLVNWHFDCFPGSIIPTTAPTGHQVKDLLWKEIGSQRHTPPAAGITQLRDPDNRDHYAVGFSPRKDVQSDEFGVQAAQGFHAEHLLFVMDEAAGVRAEMHSTMGDVIVGTHNRALLIGNPTVTSGPYFDAARSGRWNVITISALEHPNIAAGLRGEPDPIPGAVSLGWLEDKLSDPYWVEPLYSPVDETQRDEWAKGGAFEFPPMSDIWYQPGPVGEAKILGEFPTSLTDTVWALAWLERARERELEWQDGDPLEVGCDIARYGDDASTYHARRGPVSLRHESWRKEDNMATAGRIWRATLDLAEKINPPHVNIRIDTTGGHGAGPADRLRELVQGNEKFSIIDVNSSSNALDSKKYPNMRSELWFAAADAFGRPGSLDLSRIDKRHYDALSAQLTAVKYTYDSHGRMVVEPKKDMKMRVGRSPDDADAFNLAYIGGGGAQMSDVPPSEFHKRSTWATPVAEGSRWGVTSTSRSRRWRR